MRAAVSVDAGHDDQLILAQQLGLAEVFVHVEGWDAGHLAAVGNRVESAGLRLAGVEELAVGPGAVGQAALRAVEAAGQAGAPLVVCRWRVRGDEAAPAALPHGRGDSQVEAVVAAGPWPGDDPGLARWLTEAARTAGASGVRVALSTAGITDGAAGAAPALVAVRTWAAGLGSGSVGLDLCLAARSGREAGAVSQELDALVRTGRVYSVSLRGLGGEPGESRTAFLDEAGGGVPRMLLGLARAGYDGSLRAAPSPGLQEDTPWRHRGRALDLGFMIGTLQTLGCLERRT